MITAELRSSLALAPAAETFAMPGLDAFAHALPLPMWRDSLGEDVRYRCPVARLLAAQNHLDGNFLASHWRTLLLSLREKMALDAAGLPSLKSSEGIHFDGSVAFSWVEETQLEQEGDLLSWTLGARGLRRWLALGASSLALGSDLAAECSAPYGSMPLDQRRTAEREFNWQYSYGSSDRLLRVLEEAKQPPVNAPLFLEGPESLRIDAGTVVQASSALGWAGLLPLILAQMSLADALAVAPQRLIPAADQLSHAWGSWLSIQVLNDLRLSQMAEPLPLADVACLVNRLMGLSIQLVFGIDPVEQF